MSKNGLLQRLTKLLIERALNGELTNHPGYEKHDPAGNNPGNSRNEISPKTLKAGSAYKLSRVMMELAGMQAFPDQNLKARSDWQAKAAAKETTRRNVKFYRSSAPLVSIQKTDRL